MALGVVFLLVCAVAYYLNFYGAGTHYFIPFMIVLWFYLCVNAPRLTDGRLAALGLLVAALLCANVASVGVPTVKRLLRLPQAYEFTATVRGLERGHSVLSEDTFFFRTSYGCAR